MREMEDGEEALGPGEEEEEEERLIKFSGA